MPFAAAFVDMASFKYGISYAISNFVKGVDYYENGDGFQWKGPNGAVSFQGAISLASYNEADTIL